MSTPFLAVPPIRVCLEDAYSRMAGGRNDPPPAIEKQWYLYWSGLADRLNGLVGHGRRDERPDAGSVPDGALFLQLDPGYVIYQSIDGEWHYVAGTMYGTMNSPDQRPTDLGPNDAGFTFRAVDTNPQYSGREFIWSGSLWVEDTPARFGTHAARLALPVANAVNGMLWIETDRSEVIYQLQGTAWHFLAGTMWGTVTPDQRPTDLGVNDAGFSFRGTDVARSFIWSGTAWVETTPPPPVPQTPWASDIDAAHHKLLNVAAVGIDTPTPIGALEVNVFGSFAYFRSNTVTLPPGFTNGIALGWNRSGGAAEANLVFGGPRLEIGNWNGSAYTACVLFLNTGGISMPLLPSANPGAGTKQFWYDPADGNRVKFSA